MRGGELRRRSMISCAGSTGSGPSSDSTTVGHGPAHQVLADALDPLSRCWKMCTRGWPAERRLQPFRLDRSWSTAEVAALATRCATRRAPRVQRAAVPLFGPRRPPPRPQGRRRRGSRGGIRLRLRLGACRSRPVDLPATSGASGELFFLASATGSATSSPSRSSSILGLAARVTPRRRAACPPARGTPGSARPQKSLASRPPITPRRSRSELARRQPNMRITEPSTWPRRSRHRAARRRAGASRAKRLLELERTHCSRATLKSNACRASTPAPRRASAQFPG